MKKLITAMVLSATALSASAMFVFTPIGPAEFKLNLISQAQSFHQISGKTNTTATATNTTTVLKATINSEPFDEADMLSLLANSFNTNFPAGSQIGMRLGSLVVVDSFGTNVIFTPSNNVVSIQFDAVFNSGLETIMETENSSAISVSGNLTQVITTSATLSYDDTLQTTQDGTHTTFAFKGLYVLNLSENLKTRIVKTTAEFQGTGGGPVRGVQSILTGTISIKATGSEPST